MITATPDKGEQECKYYREDIYIWSDRTIQTNAIILNDTLYDLIKADLVEKVESKENICGFSNEKEWLEVDYVWRKISIR